MVGQGRVCDQIGTSTWVLKGELDLDRRDQGILGKTNSRERLRSRRVQGTCRELLVTNFV